MGTDSVAGAGAQIRKRDAGATANAAPARTRPPDSIRPPATRPGAQIAGIARRLGRASEARPGIFTIPENSPIGTLVGIVPANNPSGNPLAYRIISGNTSNAFALNNLGALSVNVASVLNYENLGKNSQLPVQFELLVNITNLSNPSLTELNRRVVVAVTDVNEAPTLTTFSASVLEHTQPGTLLGTLKGSDPDFYNLLSYTILDGDTNGVFSLDPQAGDLRISGDLIRAVQASYLLRVRVSDNVGPNPLMATSTISIVFLPNYSPFTSCRSGKPFYSS